MSKDLNFRELSFLIYKAKKKIDKIRSDTASLNYKYKKTYSMKRTTICFSTLLIANALSAQVIEHFPQLGKDNTDSVIAAMTLQEKVNVVTGLGDDTWTNPPQGKATVIINGIAGCTYDIPHLGITPQLWQMDRPGSALIRYPRGIRSPIIVLHILQPQCWPQHGILHLWKKWGKQWVMKFWNMDAMYSSLRL